MRHLSVVAAGCAALSLPGPVAQAREPEHERPAAFSDLSFDDALALAIEQDRLLLVDAWASWCGPCLAMDSDTWSDDEVEAWVREHAIAIQFDVDVDEALSERLAIEAMPTIVAYRGGEIFDRSVGYKDSAELIAWLEGVRAGRSRVDMLRDEVAQPADDPIEAIDMRIEYALALTEAGRYDEALAEFEWLWDNIEGADEFFEGERSWYITGEMAELAEVHPPAVARFREFRDEIEIRLQTGGAEWSDLDDWIALNRLVDEQDRTIAWAKRIRGRSNGPATLRRVEEDLFEVAVEEGEWALAGECMRSPAMRANEELSTIEFMRMVYKQRAAAGDLPEGMTVDEIVEMMLESIRCDVSDIYGACLAAGRFDDAQAVAAGLLRVDDQHLAREHMVRHAIRAGVVLSEHQAWLDAAAQAGVEVDQERRDDLKRVLEAGQAVDPGAG